MLSKKGFSVLEILVVVLIIAILTTIVAPWLWRAILKVRYSSILLPARTVWEGQEAYHLIHGEYASDVNDLDLTVPTSPEITLEVHGTGDYAYVKASRGDFNAHFVLYQKNSKYFAGETHCEALADDTNANWVCTTGFHGTPVEGGGPTAGYNTYVLFAGDNANAEP